MPARDKSIASLIREIFDLPIPKEACPLIFDKDGHIQNMAMWHARYLNGDLLDNKDQDIDKHLLDCRRCENQWDALSREEGEKFAWYEDENGRVIDDPSKYAEYGIVTQDDMDKLFNPPGAIKKPAQPQADYKFRQYLEDVIAASADIPVKDDYEILRNVLVALQKGVRASSLPESQLGVIAVSAGWIERLAKEFKHVVKETQAMHPNFKPGANAADILRKELIPLLRQLAEAVNKEKGGPAAGR